MSILSIGQPTYLVVNVVPPKDTQPLGRTGIDTRVILGETLDGESTGGVIYGEEDSIVASLGLPLVAEVGSDRSVRLIGAYSGFALPPAVFNDGHSS